MDSLFGPMLALASALVFGTSDFVGGVLSRGRNSAAVVGASQACALVALLIVAPFVGFPADHGWIPWSIFAAVAGSTGLVLFYRALSIGTVGVVSPIAALGAIVPIAVGFLQGERPAPLALVGMALAVVGAVLASGPEFRHESPHKAQAVLLAMVVAVLFGLAMLGIARGSQTSAFATMVGMRTTSVTAFGIAALVTRGVGGIRARDLPALAGLGVGDVGANILYGFATTLGMLSLTTVLNSIYPVVTVGMAALFLHERIARVQLVGVLAAVAGVALISVA